MKTIKEFNRLVILLALVLAGSSLLISSANASITVIGNPDISDTSLSASDIENIFLGKKKSLPSGQKVKVVTLKSGASHDEFLSSYVKKSASQFSAFWKRKIVDGTGIPPKSFESEADLVAYIKSKSGTIGYISSDTPADGVKTIAVQ